MSRLLIFRELVYHAWYGRLFKKLSKTEIKTAEDFIEARSDLQNIPYILEAQRSSFFLKNGLIMNELLLVTGQIEREQASKNKFGEKRIYS